jgi:hypothetical protein
MGWQRDYQRAEDELDDPRSLASPDWQAFQVAYLEPAGRW